MKVKFLKNVQSGIGDFLADEIHELEDEYIINNWIENELIEEAKEGRKKKVVTDEN